MLSLMRSVLYMAYIGHFSGLILTSAVCLSLEVSSDLNETDP